MTENPSLETSPPASGAEQALINKLNADLVRKTQEVFIIREISQEINTTLDLNLILSKMLLGLERTFGFHHSMVLLADNEKEILRVASSHGYPDSGIGAEVKFGEGVIGVVAKRKKMMRMGNIGAQIQYLNNVKQRMNSENQQNELTLQIPGLNNVQSQVAIPLLSENRLVGVLAVESERASLFDVRDELIITTIANQAASAIEKANAHGELRRVNENLENLVDERTAELKVQKELVEEKNKDITDSIRYAKRMQDALLPSKEYMDNELGEYFTFYRPKDIVSGDFYWVNRKDGNTYFSIVDCTGHGVPGAFLSLMAHAGLQRALLLFNLRKPREILDKLNEGVEEMFLRTDRDTDIKDGMDIALCNLKRHEMQMEFSGAMMCLYHIRGEKLTEIRGDKQPIGHFDNRVKYTPKVIDVQPGDMVYLFSDGYADQFGGPAGKKFRYTKFDSMLLSIAALPMEEQRRIVEQEFNTWKGEQEQVDDITIFGLRI